MSSKAPNDSKPKLPDYPTGAVRLAGFGDEVAAAFHGKDRRADRVLYLDFDGVLHHEAVYLSRKTPNSKPYIFLDDNEAPGHKLFEWAKILVKMLEDPADADVKIVLSTSWAVVPGFHEAKKRLPDALQSRVIGATHHSRVHGASDWSRNLFQSTPRGGQILDDVNRRRPREWIALDDNTDFWPQDHLRNLIACDGKRGILDPGVRERFREWLVSSRKCLATPQAPGFLGELPASSGHLDFNGSGFDSGESRDDEGGRSHKHPKVSVGAATAEEIDAMNQSSVPRKRPRFR